MAVHDTRENPVKKSRWVILGIVLGISLVGGLLVLGIRAWGQNVLPARASVVGSVNVFLKKGLVNCIAAPDPSADCASFTWSGGIGQIEIYPTAVPLGVFDSASASMEYSSDGGDSFQPVEGLLGGLITTEVRLVDLVMPEGWEFQLVVIDGLGSESLTWTVGRIAQ